MPPRSDIWRGYLAFTQVTQRHMRRVVLSITVRDRKTKKYTTNDSKIEMGMDMLCGETKEDLEEL